MNLLAALDALLSEGSVTGAGRRLGLSASAMSRTLARLRAATGDPLLVRAGRGLVPTPRATAIRDRVPNLVREVRAVLRPQVDTLDLATLERTFTLRTSEGFVETMSAPIAAAILEAAPRLRLRFAPKPEKTAGPLRDGLVDLEIGVIEDFAPEVRRQVLFHDDFVGVVRSGHPLLARKTVTPQRYAACNHVVASRHETVTGPVDDALAALGLRRTISIAVPGYPDAMRIARQSDLVALVPRSCVGNRLSHDAAALAGLASFDLPVATPRIAVTALWHPRMEADPAHRWLRETVIDLCRAAHTRS